VKGWEFLCFVMQLLTKEVFIFSGIAFPTCVSVNNCICHFSPVPSEADYTLKDEDMVKV
jgi:methionine aminopeptidase